MGKKKTFSTPWKSNKMRMKVQAHKQIFFQLFACVIWKRTEQIVNNTISWCESCFFFFSIKEKPTFFYCSLHVSPIVCAGFSYLKKNFYSKEDFGIIIFRCLCVNEMIYMKGKSLLLLISLGPSRYVFIYEGYFFFCSCCLWYVLLRYNEDKLRFLALGHVDKNG
jgi:hypothetical protein